MLHANVFMSACLGCFNPTDEVITQVDVCEYVKTLLFTSRLAPTRNTCSSLSTQRQIAEMIQVTITGTLLCIRQIIHPACASYLCRRKCFVLRRISWYDELYFVTTVLNSSVRIIRTSDISNTWLVGDVGEAAALEGWLGGRGRSGCDWVGCCSYSSSRTSSSSSHAEGMVWWDVLWN